MLPWVVAALGGAALALVSYGWRELRGARSALIVLRAAAITLLLALLFNAPVGPRRALPPFIALDVSSSWIRGGDSSAWRAALARARATPGDSLFVFGDSMRHVPRAPVPADVSTRAQPLADRALGAGRALVIVTDGELDDPASLRALPGGSRVDIVPHTPVRDLAVVTVDAPRTAVDGDTSEIHATLRAGGIPVPPSTLTVTLGARPVATVQIDSMAGFAERNITVRAPLSSPTSGPSVLTVAVHADADAEVRNDTVSLAIDISRAAGAVLVSSSPDYDARFVLPVLRGAVALPTRAYFRVAPNAWRQDGTLSAVSERTVRGAVHDAPLAIIHGDTAVFGPPRAATTGALALMLPATDTVGEWYAVAAPPSPIAAALSGIVWDSLPPISATLRPSGGGWAGLTIARARQLERRTAVTGSADGRRVAIVTGSGYWRWRFRGGASADAYDALWGALFDWLVAERTDARGAIPAEGVVREGDRIRWRRGSAPDTIVAVQLRRRGGTGVDSLMLRFGPGASVAESEPLQAGLYDVIVRGGTAVLAVNRSRELLPRAPSVRAGPTGGAPIVGDAPLLRDHGWPFVLLIVLLCAEWLSRRRVGLR